jgi:uncharacterized membrane protein
MEHHNGHTIKTHHNHMSRVDVKSMQSTNKDYKSNLKLATSATIHCLLGCGLGEVLGMIIGNALNMNMIDTTILSVILGFVAGLSLGIVPLLRAEFHFTKAFKTLIVAEGLSIAVMEAFEVMTQWMIPGVMEASLSEGIFWVGMMAALVVGFLAALPVNYFMIKRGVRHHH